MIKQLALQALSVVLILTLLPVRFTAEPPAKAAVSPVSELSGGDYEDGQVLVTLAAPDDTPLTKEGEVSFDSDIYVEGTWNFDSAESLGKTEEEQDFLSDKTLCISHVSSDKYSTKELMRQLKKQAYVVSVEPDYIQKKMSVTDDTFSDMQWHLTGESYFAGSSEGIRYSAAKNTGSQAPIVAVVDSGINYRHEDLTDHMWTNPYPSLKGTVGYDFGDNDADPSDEEDDGHGTHCAGLIGAVTDNQTGIAGVCPDVRLMALKIFNYKGEAHNSAIVEAFNYIYEAKKLGANIAVVNCSWGGSESPKTLSNLINRIGDMGTLFVFAAGNDGENVDALPARSLTCPYDLSSDYLVLVGGSDLRDEAASFSNYGASRVDLFAPGAQMLSTLNQSVFFPDIYPESKRESLCSLYDPCTDNTVSLYSPTDVGKRTSNLTYRSITHSAEDFFGDKSGGSVCVEISAPDIPSSSLNLYADVTDLNLSSSDTFYSSFEFGIMQNDSVEWVHYTDKHSATRFVNYRGRKYLKIVSLSGYMHDISRIYIDNIAVSAANPSTELFGQYDMLSGTSMAAPIVSGVVAAMASLFPDDTALQKKERLLSCTRAVSALSGKCKTGGIIDMSKIADSTVSPAKPTPSESTPSENTPSKDSSSADTKNDKKNSADKNTVKVVSVKLNKKKATLYYGKKLRLSATASPSDASNKKIRWSVSRKKYAKVSQTGVVKPKKKGIGHTVKIYAKATDGSGKKAYCKVKIKRKRRG